MRNAGSATAHGGQPLGAKACRCITLRLCGLVARLEPSLQRTSNRTWHDEWATMKYENSRVKAMRRKTETIEIKRKAREIALPSPSPDGGCLQAKSLVSWSCRACMRKLLLESFAATCKHDAGEGSEVKHGYSCTSCAVHKKSTPLDNYTRTAETFACARCLSVQNSCQT